MTAAASGHLSVQACRIGLVVTTTAVGTLLPILRDRGELGTSFGPFVLAAGAIGEFCPLIGLSLFLASDRPWQTAGVLLLFVGAALVVVGLALRSRTPRVIRMVGETLTTSAQLGVRVGILLCILLVWVATAFDLDFLLGAFTACIILRLFLAEQPTRGGRGAGVQARGRRLRFPGADLLRDQRGPAGPAAPGRPAALPAAAAGGAGGVPVGARRSHPVVLPRRPRRARTHGRSRSTRRPRCRWSW